ncbi:MAG: flagellar filament outer layer protein FlaA [Spirochaetes bacterium]|nr:flagellar filament outer layer protein FlaA [Spirochaetota bacterium]
MSSFTKKLLLFLLIMTIPCLAFAQQAGAPVAENIGVNSAQQRLREISVTKFNNDGFFRTAMSRDAGFITMRRHRGGPLGKIPIEAEARLGIEEEDIYVLGLRVNFDRRGVHTFAVMPVRPIPIPGITKTLSVWVVGRNTNHMLSIMLLDQHGQPKELTMGRLNFSGWRQMTVAVPPEISQRNHRHPSLGGLSWAGFRVVCDLVDTWGSYFIYFDDLRAVTDLFAEESRDIDDMVDGW